MCILELGSEMSQHCQLEQARGDQKRKWNPLELEQQTAVSLSVWRLGPEPRSSGRTASALNSRARLQPLYWLLFLFIS